MSNKVAIVTGSNKGIGFGIVRELCKRGVGSVYLTARDVKRGQEAVECLKKEGFEALFYQLEVTDENNVKAFAEYIKKTHGGLDILINNAGVITENFTKTSYDDSKYVIDVNYKGVLVIQEFLFPVLRDNARVVNVSSDCGHISILRNECWISRLTKNDIKIDDINEFVDWFLNSIKNRTLENEDFAETPLLAYRISKVALCALTRLQQREIGRDISINSLHPGFVKTNMTKNAGFMSIEEASEAPVYLALDADQSLKGKYIWFDKTEKEWANPELKLHSIYALFEKELKLAKQRSQPANQLR